MKKKIALLLIAVAIASFNSISASADYSPMSVADPVAGYEYISCYGSISGSYYYVQPNNSLYWVGNGHNLSPKPVKLCQAFLKAAGYYFSNVDGLWGTNSANAASTYQSDRGLLSDAICGTDTWSSLYSYTSCVSGQWSTVGNNGVTATIRGYL